MLYRELPVGCIDSNMVAHKNSEPASPYAASNLAAHPMTPRSTRDPSSNPARTVVRRSAQHPCMLQPMQTTLSWIYKSPLVSLRPKSNIVIGGVDGARTRDPGVTGRYSNQLNYHSICESARPIEPAQVAFDFCHINSLRRYGDPTGIRTRYSP